MSQAVSPVAFGTLLLLAAMPALAGEKDRPATPKAPALYVDEKKLLELVNAERDKEGVAPLKVEAKLLKLARDHSANMVRLGKFDHELEGKSPFDRAKEAGYPGVVGENIAGGARTPAEAVQIWMNSQGHRENILNTMYTEIGLGVARDINGTRYWTLVFGRRFKAPQGQP